MNGFDIALLVILSMLVLLGALKGLTRLLIGIGALIAAFMLASHFHEPLALQLRRMMDFPDSALKLLAYVLIFLGTMVAGGIVSYLVRKLLKVAMLSWADRLAGAALGLVATLLVTALLVLPLVAYSPHGEKMLRDSVLAPYVTVVADVANHLVPDGMSDAYREKVEELRLYWREQWDGKQDSENPSV